MHVRGGVCACEGRGVCKLAWSWLRRGGCSVELAGMELAEARRAL